MLIRFLLPTLLFALLCNSSLKASSVSTEEDPEEETNPLMMMRGEKVDPHKKGPSEKEYNFNRKNSNVNSSQPRENISEIQGSISDDPNQGLSLGESNNDGAWIAFIGSDNQHALNPGINKTNKNQDYELYDKISQLNPYSGQDSIIKKSSFLVLEGETLNQTTKGDVLSKNSLNINSFSNEVEALFEETKKYHPELLNSQKMHAAIEGEIGRLRLTYQEASQYNIGNLIKAKEKIDSSINRYDQLINAQVSYANQIKSSYSNFQLDSIIKEEALAKSDYLLAKSDYLLHKLQIGKANHQDFQIFTSIKSILKSASNEAIKEKPQKEVTNLYLEAVDLYLQTVMVLDDDHSLSNTEVKLIRSKYHFLVYKAKELQGTNKKPLVINHISTALEWCDQAIARLKDETDPDREGYAQNIGDIAYKINKIIEREQLSYITKEEITKLDQAFNFYRQAVAALENKNDPDRFKKVEYWNNAGDASRELVRECTKPKSQYSASEALEYFKQAVTALENEDDPDRNSRAECLNNIGKAILDANYRNIKNLSSNPLDVGDVRHSANALRCFKKALDVLNNEQNPNRIEWSALLNNAGELYLEAAKKSEGWFFNREIISRSLEQAQALEQRYRNVSGDTPCTIS